MRELVARYLRHSISRRDFLKGLTATGVSLSTAESILGTLVPVAHAQDAGSAAARGIKVFEGTERILTKRAFLNFPKYYRTMRLKLIYYSKGAHRASSTAVCVRAMHTLRLRQSPSNRAFRSERARFE